MADIWTQNGLSNEVVVAGQGILFGQAVVGGPIPVFEPNAINTVWTTISPEPEG